MPKFFSDAHQSATGRAKKTNPALFSILLSTLDFGFLLLVEGRTGSDIGVDLLVSGFPAITCSSLLVHSA